MSLTNGNGANRATKMCAVAISATALLCTVLGAVLWAANCAGESRRDINNNSVRVEKLEMRLEQYEVRIRAIEKTTTAIERDVAWIRLRMERETGEP